MTSSGASPAASRRNVRGRQTVCWTAPSAVDVRPTNHCHCASPTSIPGQPLPPSRQRGHRRQRGLHRVAAIRTAARFVCPTHQPPHARRCCFWPCSYFSHGALGRKTEECPPWAAVPAGHCDRVQTGYERTRPQAIRPPGRIISRAVVCAWPRRRPRPPLLPDAPLLRARVARTPSGCP